MKSEFSPVCRLALIPSRTILLAAAMSLGLAGCASQAELPPQITQNLVELRDQVVQGKAQVQMTCNAARDLTQRPQAQLQPQIDRLIQAIASLDSLATNNRQQFATAVEHANAYFAHWDTQMKGLSDSLAEQGQQRRARSMETFSELKSRTETLKKEFRPFMSSLLEVSRYLQTDTTTEGVKIVTQQIKTTLERENSIMAKADSVIAQIDAMRGGK
jgi:hypothetical protein